VNKFSTHEGGFALAWAKEIVGSGSEATATAATNQAQIQVTDEDTIKTTGPIALGIVPDGDMYIAVSTNLYGGGVGRNIWVMRLKEDGTIEAQKTYSTAADDTVSRLVALPDGVILAGTTNGISVSQDAWVLRLDRTLQIDSGCPSGMGVDTNASTHDTVLFTQTIETHVRNNQIPPTIHTMHTPNISVVPQVTSQCSGSGAYAPVQSSAPSNNSTAAPAVRPQDTSYTPGQEPVYTPPQPTRQVPRLTTKAKASFTKEWDKRTGVLRLDASASTTGFKYQWFFGWLTGTAQSPDATENPQMVMMVQENQLTGNNPSVRWVVLNLVDDSGKVYASDRQMLE
jgi:hypothetical protein